MRRHGIAWATPGLKAASLDHAMWWHRPVRVDEWLLYVQESPSASGGRGLSLGRIFTRDGELVASVAQEGMVRIPGASQPDRIAPSGVCAAAGLRVRTRRVVRFSGSAMEGVTALCRGERQRRVKPTGSSMYGAHAAFSAAVMRRGL